MAEITLIEKPVEKTKIENINPESLKDVPIEQKVYKAEKIKLSENIQKFDKKPRVSSPYDYNTVSLGQGNKNTPITLTAQQLITDPLYNTVGKFLGVDTLHDWSQQCDKIVEIVDWAKKKSGVTDIDKIVDWLAGASNVVPSFGMNHKKIDQLYMYAQLQMQKER